MNRHFPNYSTKLIMETNARSPMGTAWIRRSADTARRPDTCRKNAGNK